MDNQGIRCGRALSMRVSYSGHGVTERNLYNKDMSMVTHFLHGWSLVLPPLRSKNHNCWSNLRPIYDTEVEYDVIQNTLTEHLACGRYCDTHCGSKRLRATALSPKSSLSAEGKTHKETNMTWMYSLTTTHSVLILSQALD